MKLLTYLLLVHGIDATQTIVKIVDQAANATKLSVATNASTTTPQSAISLASLSAEDAHDDVTLIRDVATNVRLFANTLGDVMSSPVFKGLAAGLGAYCFYFTLVLMFLPKQPSATEKAISAAMDKITDKMDVLHKEQMAEMS